MAQVPPSQVQEEEKKKRRKIIAWWFFSVVSFVGFFWILFLVNQDPETEGQLSVTPTEVTLEKGSTDTLVLETNLSFDDLLFESLDTSRVRVSESIVEGLEVGSAVIVVKSRDGSVSDTVLVTVIPVPDLSITLILDGEVQTLTGPISVSTLEAPVREGFVFLGWKLPTTEAVIDDDFTIESDTELISVFEPVEIEAPEPEPEAPTVHTVTILSESNVTLTAIEVENGQVLDDTLLPLESKLFRGYYEVGQTCENPFDLDTLITGSFVLVQGELNQTSPCIELDEMAFSGSFRVGETITAHVSPSSATVTYAWFTSDNNRDFFPVSNITSASIELSSLHFRQYLAVNIQGIGDYEGLLKRSTDRIALNTNTVQAPSVIPIASVEDLLAINSSIEHTFAAGTNQEIKTAGGPDKNYRLITNVAFTTLVSNPTDTAIINQIYTGTFDGNGFDISGVYISSSGTHLGLFKGLNNATVKNVTLSQFNITGDSIIGALSGTIEGKSLITQVTVTHSTIFSSQSSDNSNIGGFVGQVLTEADLTINHLINAARVTGKENHVGGFLGSINDDSIVSIVDSVNYGDIISEEDEAAGFVGDNNGVLVIENSFNYAAIIGDDELGGFAGDSNQIEIRNSINYGVISTSSISSGGQIGGLIGDGGDSEGDSIYIFQSANYGTVFGTDNEGIGGLIGQINDADTEIVESFNAGKVIHVGSNTTDIEAGGIVGEIFSAFSSVTESITLSSVYNSGVISGTGQDAELGGLIASVDETQLHIENSYNVGLITGSVSGTLKIGALVATTGSATTIVDSYYLSGSALLGTHGGNTNFRISDGAMRLASTFSEWDIFDYPNKTGVWTIGYDRLATYPWLSWLEAPNLSTAQELIPEGYIPVASIEDLQSINSNTSHTFAAMTKYELVTNGGLSNKYILVNDIDLSGTTYTNSLITGTFVGSFEGSNYTLSNLHIDATKSNIGLFSQLGTNAAIYNLTFGNFNITGQGNVGLLAGRIKDASNITISSVSSMESNLIGDYNVGGLVGEIGNSTSVYIEKINLHNTLKNLDDNSYHFGGIVGNIELSLVSIDQAVNIGSIETTGNHIGGIIGLVRDSSVVTLSSISQHATVSGIGAGTTDVGGLIGQVRISSSVHILNANNTGNISNTNNRESGGLIGRVGESSREGFVTIENSYNSGSVSSNGGNAGSIIGAIEDSNSHVTLSGVYILSGSALNNTSIGNNEGTLVGSVTRASVARMTSLSNFDNWDIAKYPNSESVWSIQYDGQTTYPWLTFTDQPHTSQIVNTVPVLSGADFKTIEDNLFGSFLIEKDIDLTSYTNITQGFIQGVFTGNISGQGFKLENLSINGNYGENQTFEQRDAGTNIGLFRIVSGASFENIVIDSFNITGTKNVGSLVGLVQGDTKINYFNNITVTGGSVYASANNLTSCTSGSACDHSANVGSLIGEISSSNAHISDIFSNANVSSGRNYIGGIVGSIYESDVTIENSTYSGIVKGGTRMGGIIGLLNGNTNVTLSSLTISADSSVGQTGQLEVGGVIGDVFGAVDSINGSNIDINATLSGGSNLGAVIGRLAINVPVEITGITNTSGVTELIGSIPGTTGNTISRP